MKNRTYDAYAAKTDYAGLCCPDWGYGGLPYLASRFTRQGPPPLLIR